MTGKVISKKINKDNLFLIERKKEIKKSAKK
jgi:hypothetical protein